MSNNNNKQTHTSFTTVNVGDVDLGIPEINQVTAASQNLVQSAEASTTTPALKPQEKNDSLGFLLDCAKRGQTRGKQPSPSICKVSRILRDHNKSSFEPQLVSIGPIHREDPKLKEYEWQKDCYLYDLLRRCSFRSTPKEILEACLLKVDAEIDQIGESYAGMENNYSDVELARMMVMDGCFILEFCFKHKNEDKDLPNKMQNTRIAMDLMLLENQVPFFVLQALFDCFMGKQSFTLSDVLDDYLATYIKLFHSDLLPEKNSPTDVDHSDLPEKNSPTNVDLPEKNSTTDVEHSDFPEKNSPTNVDLPEKNSTTDVEHSDSPEKNSPTNVDLPEKNSTTDVNSDSTHDHVLGYLHRRYQLVVDKYDATSLCSSFCIIFRKCTWSNCVMARFLHAEASKHVDEEQGAKSSNTTPADAEASKHVDEEQGAKSSNPTPADAEASKPEDDEGIKNTTFHSIVELDRSGVNFKPHKEDKWSMTIKFQSSVFAWLPFFWKPTLLMPTLVIEDSTELILRNFIAYEQSFPQDRHYFTSYAYAMDMLIDTQEDIAKLVDSKVLVNRLGSNQEAAGMINKICKNVLVKNFCYTEQFKKMDEYYNRSWPRNIAWLRRVYFSNPWSFIALVAATIVSLATVVATIFAVLDYYR